jgi:hypothetical protein
MLQADWASWRIYLRIQLAVACLAVLLPLMVGSEEHRGIFEMPRCSVLETTGKSCATCGLTRSLHTLYRGEVSRSRAYHPYGWLVALVLGMTVLYRVMMFRLDIRHYRPWFMAADLTLGAVGLLVSRLGLELLRG